jgi:hypothetical protein
LALNKWLKRRPAGRVMAAAGAVLVLGTLALLPALLRAPRGLKFLGATTVVLASGWIHAGLTTPGLKAPPRRGLVLLGLASLLVAWRWTAAAFPGAWFLAGALVVAAGYGVLGLGWGA